MKTGCVATRRSGTIAGSSLSAALLGGITLLALALPGFAKSETPPDAAVSDHGNEVATPKPEPAPTLSPEELGDLHMARRRYQAALEAYRKTPEITARVWNKIGIADQQLFMMEEARKSYEQSLKLDPHNPDVMNNIGTVYYSMKEYGLAERMYRKALKLRPKSGLIYKNLGTDLLAAGKFKKGWECYQSALEIDPDIFERNSQMRIGEPTPVQRRGAMNFYLAKSYMRAGRNDRAVEYLRMAIDQGFTDRRKVMADKEFVGLHGTSAFEQLLAEQRN